MRLRSFFAVVVMLSVATVAHAKSPVQVVPDGADSTVLVNKTVGSSQWVLALNTDDINADTGASLTGNVFDTGKPPTFFYCAATLDDNFTELADLASESITFDCQVASGCTALPCTGEWQPVGGGSISLPGSFFLP